MFVLFKIVLYLLAEKWSFTMVSHRLRLKFFYGFGGRLSLNLIDLSQLHDGISLPTINLFTMNFHFIGKGHELSQKGILSKS